MRTLLRSSVALLMWAAALSLAPAQTTYTWNGAVNGNWNTAGNWTPGIPANSATLSDVAFAGTTNLVTTVDLLQGSGGGTYDLRTISFLAGAGTFNVTPSNSNVTLLRIGTGGIVNNSTVDQTFSNPLVVGASHTWNASTGNLLVDGPVTATGQTLTFGGASEIKVTGVITGGALVKTGAGTTTLSGNNTPTAVAVNQGTLIANKAGSGSPIGTAPVTLAGGTLSFRVFGNPIAVSGFNHDVITAVSEFISSPYGTTRAVDGADGSGNFVYFQQGVNTANPTFGAPASGRFQAVNNPSVTYQLGDYTGNNVLSMASNTAGSAATTLTLTTPGAYRSLSIMNVTGSGSATYSFTLNFADSTSTTVTGNVSPDWFNGPAAVTLFQVNGRLNRNAGTFDSVGSGNPRIYGQDYTLSAADQLKTLNSITFATTNTGGYTFNVFGLAGTAGSDTQVFTNSMVVTADSTLDQQNVSSVTVGPLSIGTNVLTTTGTAGTSMTLGAVSLTGNPTFAPQTNATLVLGPLTGGATIRTVTKTGGGTLTLGSAAASLAAGSAFTATGGTTNLNAAGALGTGAAVTANAGATVNLGANQTVASLAGAGTVALGANGLTVGGGGAASFGGTLSGGSLVVTGAGTAQTLAGITSGTAVTVQTGGKLSTFASYSLGGGGVTLSGTSTLALGVGGTPVNVTGFGGTGTGWNLQGTTAPTVAGDVMTLTPNAGGVAASAWYGTQVPTGPFNATFRYSQQQGTGGADGMTFTLQSQSGTAVGTAGGGLGYAGINPSVAFAINIYGPNTPGIAYTANGAQPTTPYLGVAPVNFQAAGTGGEVTVNLSYDGANLTGSLVQGANTFTLPTVPVNIASIVGANAFVGFTGGTGGVSAQQSIDLFSFATPNTSVYTAPVNLAASAVATLAVNFNATYGAVTIPSLAAGAGAALTVQAETGTAANTAYGLTVSGATTLAGATTFTVQNNGSGLGTVTLGATSGAGGITKAGPGTLLLTGAGTYSGNTTVNAGTLSLTGAGSFASSPVITVVAGATLNGAGVTGGTNFDGTRFALANGQTLQGAGSVTGPLGVRTGSMISPGTSPGVLTVSGGLVFTGGAYGIDVNGPAAGTGYDQIRVTSGNVNLGAGVATLLVLTTSGTGYTSATRLVIIDNQGAGTTTGTFTGLAEGAQVPGMNGLGGFNWNIYYNADAGTGNLTGGNDVVMAMVPVPEPGLLIALSAAGLGLAHRVRRRRR